MKKRINITVASASKAKNFVSDIPWAAIQISTHPGDFPKLNKCQQQGLLQLSFPDLDAPSNIPVIGPEGTVYQRVTEEDLFNEDHALQILNFVNEMLTKKVNTFLIHCQAGYCRSPAVAAALCKLLNGHMISPCSEYSLSVLDGIDSWYFDSFAPNIHVYYTLVRAGVHFRWTFNMDSLILYKTSS